MITNTMTNKEINLNKMKKQKIQKENSVSTKNEKSIKEKSSKNIDDFRQEILDELPEILKEMERKRPNTIYSIKYSKELVFKEARIAPHITIFIYKAIADKLAEFLLSSFNNKNYLTIEETLFFNKELTTNMHLLNLDKKLCQVI